MCRSHAVLVNLCFKVTMMSLLDKQFASIFRLYRIARSSTILLLNLLLVYLVNTTCAIINIMANLIFTIVSRLHAFFLVVPIRSSLHALVVVAVISYFQQRREESELAVS